MSSAPRRRPSRAVYRRRRLVAVLVVLVLVVAGWLVIAQPWRSGAAPVESPAPIPSLSSPAPSVSPSPSASTVAIPSPETSTSGTPATQACTSELVTVEAITDQSAYAADASPELSIRLINVGEVPCTINVGTTAQVFTVTSGNDVWWRSTDCQQEPSDMIVTLAAGQTVTSAQPLVWDRTRSSVSTCESGSRARAPSAGASYHLNVEVGGIASAQSAQFQLR